MDARTLVPPIELASRLGGALEDYHRIGGQHAALLRDLVPANWQWSGKRVLDFGCGTGRTLVQFSEEVRTGEFHGCDIDEPSIAWATKNLSPPFRFVANEELPPIDLPSGSFDLIYGFSVFTHLVDAWSAWLLEIHRLLTPGGLGIFTFLGEGMIEEVAGHAWDEDRIGMIGLDIGKPWAIGGPNVLHSEWWLRAHWGRAFEITGVRPFSDPISRRGHGLIVLRKDDRLAPTQAQLEALETDEPREVASLQYAVQLLGERMTKLWNADSGAMMIENDRLRACLNSGSVPMNTGRSRLWRAIRAH
jgi:SAM-dependent methyltransferase